ncbi:hypothetical protein WR25_20461 [Diploscapter pachys]|uniref:Fucosyltransferase n=1 Tax=Diploscapter pachys TaxID=2018661 RepID=A0A2A2LBY2_9BILA|nr:hypothetical protein WR25_20461 [Diploscapter pachys]
MFYSIKKVQPMKNFHQQKVDKYGRCGKAHPTCNGNKKLENSCTTDAIRPYKFYIAIENSNCNHYVTEKFYYTLHTRMTIPIVLSRKFYQDLDTPDDAYIAIDDFPTLDEFVDRINRISTDKELYLSYHKWRKNYRVVLGNDDATGFCELCRRLLFPINSSKSYEDINGWNSNGMCNNTIVQYLINRDVKWSKNCDSNLTRPSPTRDAIEKLQPDPDPNPWVGSDPIHGFGSG